MQFISSQFDRIKLTYFFSNYYQEMFETSKRSITVAMMKTYPQLLRKFMPDKDKVAPLVEIIVHMNLELYSLKRQEQVNSLNKLLSYVD